MKVEEPGGVGSRQSVPRWLWILIVALWSLSLALTVANKVRLERTKAAFRAEFARLEGRGEDWKDLRAIAAAFATTVTDDHPAPLDAEGRLDVYELLKGHPDAEKVRLCFSDWAGKGPSLKEIEAGDYKNFPYQRRRGALEPLDDEATPVVWQRERLHGQWTVALANGTVTYWDEDHMEDFFRGSPGQE